ncbi:ABC transporter permease [Leptolinea tardivitalis]|nr:ABC transporter permease [Leptolinea tardivitalis]GAP22472.1 nucleoside ABC transporter membrane protein [Leptolinea tardivitalis]
MPSNDAAPKGRAARSSSIDWRTVVVNIAIPLAGMLIALTIGAILLVFLNVNPFDAYAVLMGGAFGSWTGLAQALVKATPLLLVGLGICIAFRASVINIGGEGQIIAGALMAAWWPLQFRSWPGWLLISTTLIMGFLAGSIWGFIPGLLKARLKVNEILSTVMMNSIAAQLMNLLIRGPLIDPAGVAAGTYLAQSERLPANAWLPRLVPQTLLNAGAIVAVILAVVVYIFLWRTTIGYRIRAVGLNPDASRYAGINVPFYQALSLTLAGGFAGLAGVVEVLGVQHRLLEGITGGYGFTGIVAALFGGLHPLGAIPASILFGGLLVGADKMQRAVQVPSSLITAILGLVVLFVVGSSIWSKRWAARRKIEAVKESEAAG